MHEVDGKHGEAELNEETFRRVAYLLETPYADLVMERLEELYRLALAEREAAGLSPQPPSRRSRPSGKS